MGNPCLGTTSQSQSQLYSGSLSSPASPKFRDGECSRLGVLESQGPAVLPPKHRRPSSFQSTVSKLACCSPMEHGTLGGFCARPRALPPFLWSLLDPQIPRATGRGAGRKGQTRTQTRCGKAPSTGRRREAELLFKWEALDLPGAGSGSLQSCPIGSGAGVAA